MRGTTLESDSGIREMYRMCLDGGASGSKIMDSYPCYFQTCGPVTEGTCYVCATNANEAGVR